MKTDITSESRILSRKMKPFYRALGALLCLISTASSIQAGPAVNDLQMTPEELKSLPENQRVILDTRSKWGYLWGHIPGAQSTGSWKDFAITRDGVQGQLNRDKKFLVEKLKKLGISPDKAIFIYGDPENKWRQDGRFFWMFEFLGFKQVYLLQGGFESWKKAGFPVERGPGNPPPASTLTEQDIEFNPETFADQQWIKGKLGDPNFVIIDNREKHEYAGSTPYGSSRGGHIPGAIHIDWRDFFTTKGQMKPDSELHGLLKQNKITPGNEIVVYCTGGVRSAMAYFVFRTLGYSVRNYDGSWWDWSHNPALPAENS